MAILCDALAAPEFRAFDFKMFARNRSSQEMLLLQLPPAAQCPLLHWGSDDPHQVQGGMRRSPGAAHAQ
jgi:hypothetical protein